MTLDLLTHDVIGTTKTMKKEYFNAVGSGKEIIFVDGEEKIINSNQKWFWTDEWQAGEKEVEKYIEEGNIQTFDSMEGFLKSLRK